MKLYERCRPKEWAEVVGQDKAVATLRRLTERGELGGSAVWLSGQPGIGKTTLAHLMARHHCGADGAGIVELDAADELRAEHLEAMDTALTFRPIWGERERRCWIINEAHGLKGGTLRRLLGILERVARDPESRILFVFTTTNEGQEDLFGNQSDTGALLSRCHCIKLTNQGLARAFAERALTIARAEGLDGQPVEAYVKLAQSCKNNFRAMLQKIAAGEMIGGGA